MADQSASYAAQSDESMTDGPAVDKGKGRAVEHDDELLGDESASESDEAAEQDEGEEEGEDDDNMEEIDTGNILTEGRRTRGKHIDFAKAAADAKDELDEDEDDDDDFVDPENVMQE